jgi:hypothetical protein
MTATQRQQAEEAAAFFMKNAGFSWNPRIETEGEGRQRCAEELAAAEMWSANALCVIEWREDGDADRSFLPDDDCRPLYRCILTLPDGRTASLGSIDLGPDGFDTKGAGAGRSYARIVVAELALELMAE